MSNYKQFDGQEIFRLYRNNSYSKNIFRPTSFPTNKPFSFSTYKPFTFPTHSFERFTLPPRHFEPYTFKPIKFDPPPVKKYSHESGPSILMFTFAVIFYVIWNNCKPNKEDEEEEDDTEAVISSNYIQQIPSSSLPVATVISETSRDHCMPNPIADRPQMSFTSSAPNVEYSQLQAYQPTAPGLDDANIPSYDCPPNYEEAMTMLRQQQKEHGSSTLSKSSNTTSTEQLVKINHQSQDTYI